VSRSDLVLYVIFPYAALTVFAVGHVWRWRIEYSVNTPPSRFSCSNRVLNPLHHWRFRRHQECRHQNDQTGSNSLHSLRLSATPVGL
jgi:nitrate reductase gamma subunit